MEDSFQRLGFFSQVLRVLRLGIWPRWCIWDGHPCAGSLDTKQSHRAKSHGGLILEARLFLSGSKSLGLDIWPRWCIWDGHPCARSLDTKQSHGAKSHGGLILEARLFLSDSKSLEFSILDKRLSRIRVLTKYRFRVIIMYFQGLSKTRKSQVSFSLFTCVGSHKDLDASLLSLFSHHSPLISEYVTK